MFQLSTTRNLTFKGILTNSLVMPLQPRLLFEILIADRTRVDGSTRPLVIRVPRDI